MNGTTLRARRLLGWGPTFVSTGAEEDIGQDIAFAGGDIALVSGMEALTQDLRLALCTGLGTDPLNQAFGSDAFASMAEESDPMMLRERIRVAVIRVLQSDARIRRIVEVSIDGEARPFTGRSRERTSGAGSSAERTTALSVVAVFETVLGEHATIAIEGLSNA